MTRKWKILCLVLLVANLAMAYWLFVTKLYLDASASVAAFQKIKLAECSAEIDFRKDLLRIFEIKPIPPESLGTNSYGKSFTGQKEGPFELWQITVNATEGKDYLRRQSEYYNAYNEYMDGLYQDKNSPYSFSVATNWSLFRSRVGYIAAPELDAQSNFYNCSLQMRMPENVRLDPLAKSYIVHDRSEAAASRWFRRSLIREEGGYKVFKDSFTIFPQFGRQEIVVQPGYHPAQVFHLSLPSPLKAMDWTAWHLPDYIESSNTIAAYKHDLDPKFHSISLPPDCFQIRYKIEAINHARTPTETSMQRMWKTIFEIARRCIMLWILFLTGWFFIEWMNKPTASDKRKIKNLSASAGDSRLKPLFRHSLVVCPFCARQLIRRNYWSWSLHNDQSRCPGCHQRLRVVRRQAYFWAILLAIPVGSLALMAVESSISWSLVVLAIPVSMACFYALSPYIFRFDPVIEDKVKLVS